MGQNYRVVHRYDPVPGQPPKWLFWYHIWPQYYITAKTGEIVTVDDVKVSGWWGSPETDVGEGTPDAPPPPTPEIYMTHAPDGFDQKESGPEVSIPGIDAHLWYLGPMSGCEPSNTQLSTDTAASA